MGPVVFTKAGIALDTSLSALFRGHRREYPLPKKLLVIKHRPPASPAPPTSSPLAPAPDPAHTPDLVFAQEPGPAPAPAPSPKPDDAPPSAEFIPDPWTEIQDAILLGLKDHQHKTWREIGALIDGRDTEECRDRYNQLEAMANAEKRAKEEEEATIKKAEEQAREEAEMRAWWEIHKAEKSKAAEAEQKAKEEKPEKEEAMAAEKPKMEEAKKEPKATRAEKRAKEKEAKYESDKAADANSDQDNKGKTLKTRGKDQPTASGKSKSKDQKPRAKKLVRFDKTSSTSTKIIGDRPIINLEGLDEEEIEEAPLLWHLRNQSEERKWIEMASRYFEATGKNVPAEAIEKKLRELGI